MSPNVPNVDPAVAFVDGAHALASASASRPVPKAVDRWDVLDQFFSLAKPSVPV